MSENTAILREMARSMADPLVDINETASERELTESYEYAMQEYEKYRKLLVALASAYQRAVKDERPDDVAEKLDQKFWKIGAKTRFYLDGTNRLTKALSRKTGVPRCVCIDDGRLAVYDPKEQASHPLE